MQDDNSRLGELAREALDWTAPDGLSGRGVDATTRRRFIGAAAAAGAALTIGGTAVARQDDTATVTFDDQETDGTSVRVAAASLPDGGFITIHDSSLQDGEVFNSVVGVTEALDAGSHENVDVPLFGDIPGRNFDRDRLEEDETLIAMPHFDSNGNGTYDFVTSEGSEDGPYTDDQGAVVDDGAVTVQQSGDGGTGDGGTGDGGDDTATVTFDDQETDGTSVRVAAASLPDGGFITIHDSSLQDGEVLKSVIGVTEALDAGSHENVDVPLFGDIEGRNFDRDRLEEDETLIAMPHFDTDGDGQYDFVCSEGAKDGPYTDDQGVVVDDAAVTVSS